MKVKLEQRLEELEAEYKSGQKILIDIENTLKGLQNRKENLEETLLRISGAIELLEELLDRPESASGVGETAGGAEERNEAPAFKDEEEVEVPKVVRLPLDKAKKTLEDAGLQVGEISKQPIFVAGINFGYVIKQNPNPGKKVGLGKTVDLVLATKGKFEPDLSLNSKLGNFCNR